MVLNAHLPLTLLIQGEQVIKGPIVDASATVVLYVGARHGVCLA